MQMAKRGCFSGNPFSLLASNPLKPTSLLQVKGFDLIPLINSATSYMI